ncbi:MAG: zinc ribbon domain-containing protein [Oscillospiraceae bacterium]|nr:zinc ribbon domain-containing protein [Oscillospiraceae bacterium]
MLRCKHCGSPLDEVNYCPWCGAFREAADSDSDGAAPVPEPVAPPEKPRFCGGCGAKLPPDCPSCLVCGLKAGELPPAPEPLPPALSNLYPSGAGAAKANNDIAIVCVVICVLLSIAAVFVWALYTLPILSSGGKSILRDAVIYQTADEKLKMMSPLLDFPETIVSGFTSKQQDFSRPLAKRSLNNRYIAYINGYNGNFPNASGSLYLLDFNTTPPDSAIPPETPISSDVTDTFFFMDNGDILVYLTLDGKLCAAGFGEIAALDTDVTFIIENTDTQILYAKSWENRVQGAFSLYMLNTKDRGIVFVDTDVTEVADYTPALDKFVYLRGDSSGNRNLIAYDLNNDNHTLLATGVDRLLSTDAATFSAIYQTASANSLRYEHLISDDYLLSDESLPVPDLDAFPLLTEYFDMYGINPAEVEILEQDEDLAEQKAALDAAIEAYDAKLERDKHRAGIKAEISAFVAENPVLYDLHVSRGGVSRHIAEGSYKSFDDAVFDPSTGIAAWSAASWRSAPKIPIMNYESVISSFGASFGEYLTLNISDGVYVYNGAPALARVGDGPFYSGGFALTTKADGIYFAMGAGSPLKERPDNMCTLYYAPISGVNSGNIVGNIVMVDERVAGVGDMLDGDRLIYYKNRAGDICSLYIMGGGQSEKIGDNVPLLPKFFMIVNDRKTLLYCERFNTARGAGDLFMLTRQTRQIAGDVRRIYYKNDGLIYFLRGGGNPGLFSFGSSGLSYIDENVISVMG